MSRIPKAVNAAVELRAAGYCEIGGAALPADSRAFARHHRKIRGSGGKGDLDVVENLVAIHHHCHDYVHGAAGQLAYDLGWLVHTWDDFAEVPVLVVPGLCADPVRVMRERVALLASHSRE